MYVVIDSEIRGAVDLLDDITGRLDDDRAMLGLVAEQLNEHEAAVFATQGRGQWAPLDPATVLLKGSSRVLVDTGDLLDAMTSARVNGEDVELDTRAVPYVKYLRGGARGAPRRDPAPAPQPSQVEGWAEDLLGYVVDGRP